MFNISQVQNPLNPIQIMKSGAEEEKAEQARLSSFVGAIAVGDLVKSTLGPKGMDKILLSGGELGKVDITNDGATILRSIGVDNPAAKVLVDISKVSIICLVGSKSLDVDPFLYLESLFTNRNFVHTCRLKRKRWAMERHP